MLLNHSEPISSQTPTRLTEEWKINEYICKTFVCVLVPVIIASNIMVVLSVAKFKRLQIPTNYFMTSLAIADIVVASALPFYVVTEMTPIYVYDDYICLASNRVLITASGVSVLTLAIIALDRYTAIMNPLEYILLMTSKKIIGYISFSWAYSAVVSWTPVFVGWYTKIEEHSYLCTGSALDSRTDILFLCALFIPTCFCVLFCYVRIYFVARHHARTIAAVENNFKRHFEVYFRRSDTKYAKRLVILIGLFLVLWLPHQTSVLIDLFLHDVTSRWTKIYLMLLAFLNSGVNPWVYAYQNSDFRAAYKKISEAWKCRCHQRHVEIENRRESMLSCISVVPNSLVRLNRLNSKIIASDILYALSQHVGEENTQASFARKMSAKHIVVNAVSSLPDILKMYANTYAVKCSDILEESFHDGTKAQPDSRDSACSLTEYIVSHDRNSPGGYSFPVILTEK